MLGVTSKSLLSLVVTAIVASSLFAADAPKKRDITLDALARIQRVGGPVVSPEGDWVVYTVSQIDTKEDKGQSHLWMVKWDGSVHLQLTYGKEGASSPKFSPDGRYIAYSGNQEGKYRIYVMTARGNHIRAISAPKLGHCKQPSWSPRL